MYQQQQIRQHQLQQAQNQHLYGTWSQGARNEYERPHYYQNQHQMTPPVDLASHAHARTRTGVRSGQSVGMYSPDFLSSRVHSSSVFSPPPTDEYIPWAGHTSAPVRNGFSQGTYNSSLGPPPNLPQNGTSAIGPRQKPEMKLSNPYGLLGLLGIMRQASEGDSNAFALGTDLTSLGLNLNSASPLYSSFLSPFSDIPQHSSVPFTAKPSVPECFTVPMIGSIAHKLSHFSDQTLMYIFYSMPRDQLQESASLELYIRSWRYHKDLHLWLTKDPESETIVKTQTYERGVFIFFDIKTWEPTKKEFTLHYDCLEEREIPASYSHHRIPGMQNSMR